VPDSTNSKTAADNFLQQQARFDEFIEAFNNVCMKPWV
jgi:hypothetical protein